ncbi:general vesicular transport factor p115-like [Teleopsis dalmanni]|uniref:general vesicular transport factor p115-like n=1 Tax=Teleopsis dalmanni TaxID=139649 RepID=UPI0018CD666B|nr:general vesicular transport factor p115-like [Teleopsis dalmanni]XP_037957045.1 general vesicular transport factor p115-like [Teleopsis dalmanni]
MNFFKTGIKSVLGSADNDQAPTAPETVEKLVDRLLHSVLLDDRRDACKALRALSREYRVEVGAQGMTAIIQILRNDYQDSEIVSYSLDTLCNVVTCEEYENECDRSQISASIGEQFTEMFIKVPENVGLIMDCLETYDFKVRRGAIHLLTMLISNRTRDLQNIILVNPLGISKLMDLLKDSREAIRNDALLLLIQLTNSNTNIQKIVTFENAYDKIFQIIHDEGRSDGGIIVEDCLILLLNLLKNNSSNQQFFKEGSYIQKLAEMFVFSLTADSWTPQKVSNVHCMLQVVRTLVSPNNQQIMICACQNVMRQSKLLNSLCIILMSSGIPADILTETINTIGEVIRANIENQNDFDMVVAPSMPPRPALVVLLMTMINEKQLLSLRCAVLYCVQCYLYRNDYGKKTVIQTLLPSSTLDNLRLSTGQLLCTGLFSSNALANWFSAVALMHTLVDNIKQKEELLRVLLASPNGSKPMTLLDQCTTLLQQEGCKLQSKLGIIMLLSTWLAYCPVAVKAFISSEGTMAFIIAQISANEHGEEEYLVQGSCAFLMGLCIQFNDNTIPSQTSKDICQLIGKRIGQETFCCKITEVSHHKAYVKACKEMYIRVKSSSDVFLDYEYCKLYKSLETQIIKLINNIDLNTEELSELSLTTDSILLVTQYKNIIRGLGNEIDSLKENVKLLEVKNTELENELLKLKEKNVHLSDYNTLLKAQVLSTQHVQSVQGNNLMHLNEDQNNSDSVGDANDKNTKEILLNRLADETLRAKIANDELVKLRTDQENLFMLLLDQDNKIAMYKRQIYEAGLSILEDSGTDDLRNE